MNQEGVWAPLKVLQAQPSFLCLFDKRGTCVERLGGAQWEFGPMTSAGLRILCRMNLSEDPGYGSLDTCARAPTEKTVALKMWKKAATTIDLFLGKAFHPELLHFVSTSSEHLSL